MPAKAAIKCKMFLNTDTYADPDWEEIANVRDPSVPKGKDMAEVTTRRHGGFKAFIATLKELGLEFEMNADDADTLYTALEDAYWNDTVLDILVLRGTLTAGVKGVRLQMAVETFDEPQPNSGAVTTTVKLVLGDPADADTPVAQRYTVPA